MSGASASYKKNVIEKVLSVYNAVEKGGKDIKQVVKKAGQNLFQPEPVMDIKRPGKTALSILDVLGESAGETVLDLIPATPSEGLAMYAGGAIMRGAGAVAGKIAPKTVSGIGKIFTTPIGKTAVKNPLTKEVVEKTVEKYAPNLAMKLQAEQQTKNVMEKLVLTDPQVSLTHTKAVVADAISKAQVAPEGSVLKDQSKRVFKRIAEALGVGDIMPENLPEILKKENISPKEFATMFTDTISTAGKQLHALSVYSKSVGKYLGKEAEEIISKVKPVESGWDKAFEFYRKLDRPRRAAMVAQTATAARNFISQAGVYTVDTIDKAIAGLNRVTFGGEAPKEAMRDAYENVFAIYRRLASPAAREGLEKLIENDTISKARLTSNIMGDLTLGNKVYKALNVLNSSQEIFFRKLALDAKLNSILGSQGLTMATASADDIAKAMEPAVQHALEMTFAAAPKSGLGKAVTGMYKLVPPLTLVNPFPRFWANAQKYLVDHSPLGYARLFDPKFVAKMASKDGAEASLALAKAQTSTLMLSGAMALRNSPYAGEKWYELKVGGKDEKGRQKYIDLRPFAPFSTYLLLAEAMKDASGEKTNLGAMDYVQGLVSINRIAGTGLALIDFLRNENATADVKIFKQVLGQFMGGYTVPLRTISDISAQFGGEEKYTRDTTTKPVLGPAMANIPGVSRSLPKAVDIYKKKDVEREQPGLRQVSGLTVKTKNIVQQEVDRLGLGTKGALPKTGNPKIDLEIKKNMSQFSELYALTIMSKGYKNLEDIDKVEVLKRERSMIKQIATAMAKGNNPKEGIIMFLKGKPKNMQKRAFEILLKNGIIGKKETKSMGVNLKDLEIE